MAQARQQYYADWEYVDKAARQFSLTQEVIEKLDSIEPGAERNFIQWIKVNWEIQTPDQYRVVDISVPEVEDTLTSYDNTAALSARQWRVLYNYIRDLQQVWHFLSNWNCPTWLPQTNPQSSPYVYNTWDYYIVASTSSWTNYKPDWYQYISWQASTTAEQETVKVWDFYVYDWTNWLLLINTERQIAIDTSLSTTSTNPVENRVITDALNWKQPTLTPSTWISIDANNNISNTLPWAIVSSTAPSSPTEWMLWYDTTNDILKSYDWTNWNEAWSWLVVLSYWNSTWDDFVNAYNKNAIVYCRASSQSNPWSWNQTRMAFMAFVDINATTWNLQGVEFQYYRSRSDHNSAANQLDQVFVYKLTSAWTWTVTERNTWAKAVAWTWISLWWWNGNMTINNTAIPNDTTISFTQWTDNIWSLTTDQATAATLAFHDNIILSESDYQNLPSSKESDWNSYWLSDVI